MKSKYLTIVYNVEGLTEDDIRVLIGHPLASYLAWDHIPHQRDMLLARVARLEKEIERLQWQIDEHD